MTSTPVEIFFSYSHKDESFREQLETHLSMLRRQGLIKPWHDRMITAGSEWAGQIDENLERADIVLLLITANFLASDYCYDMEMQRAMERHEQREARVIPIILAPVEGWQQSAFAKLQVLPKDGKPVTKWADRDEAFVNVAQGIRGVIAALTASGASSQNASTPDTPNGGSTVTPANLTATRGGLSDRKRQRLEQERDSLQSHYDSIQKKVDRLRQALAIEVDPLTKLRLEKQLEQESAQLDQAEEQLDQIEQQLLG